MVTRKREGGHCTLLTCQGMIPGRRMNRDAVSTSLPHRLSPVSGGFPAGWCAQAPVGSPISSSRHRRRRGGFAQGSTGTKRAAGAACPTLSRGGAGCPQPPVWLSGGSRLRMQGDSEALWRELRLSACQGVTPQGRNGRPRAACPTLSQRWGRLPSASRLVAKGITAQDAVELGSTRARASTLGMSGRYATGTKRTAGAGCPQPAVWLSGGSRLRMQGGQ